MPRGGSPAGWPEPQSGTRGGGGGGGGGDSAPAATPSRSGSSPQAPAGLRRGREVPARRPAPCARPPPPSPAVPGRSRGERLRPGLAHRPTRRGTGKRASFPVVGGLPGAPRAAASSAKGPSAPLPGPQAVEGAAESARGCSPRGRRAGSPRGRGARSRAAAAGRRLRAPRIPQRVPPGAGRAGAAEEEEEEAAAAPEHRGVITGCCLSPETSGAGAGPGGAREPPGLRGGLRREAGPSLAEGLARGRGRSGARRARPDAGRRGGAGLRLLQGGLARPQAVREPQGRPPARSGGGTRAHRAGLAPCGGGAGIRRLEDARTPDSASHLRSDCVALTRTVTVFLSRTEVSALTFRCGARTQPAAL